MFDSLMVFGSIKMAKIYSVTAEYWNTIEYS